MMGSYGRHLKDVMNTKEYIVAKQANGSRMAQAVSIMILQILVCDLTRQRLV